VEAEEFEKLFDDLPPKENLHGILMASETGTFMPGAAAPVPPASGQPSPTPSPS
jgi:hypothetical protein